MFTHTHFYFFSIISCSFVPSHVHCFFTYFSFIYNHFFSDPSNCFNSKSSLARALSVRTFFVLPSNIVSAFFPFPKMHLSPPHFVHRTVRSSLTFKSIFLLVSFTSLISLYMSLFVSFFVSVFYLSVPLSFPIYLFASLRFVFCFQTARLQLFEYKSLALQMNC